MLKLFKYFVLSFLLMLSSAAFSSQHLFHDYTAEYSVKHRGITVGSTTRTVRTGDNGDYDVSIDGKSKILFYKITTHEHSEGKWVGDKIRPRTYLFNYSRPGKKKRAELKFDWKKRTAYDVVDKKNWDLVLPDNANDNVSYHLALREDIMRGKTDLNYALVRHGRIKHYQFKILGHETIETALGTLNCVKVQRDKSSDNRTTFWLAPELEYVLVKLEHWEKGKASVGNIYSLKYLDADA